jgi:hypothetical protein
MNCKNCGARLKENAVRCSNCGAPVYDEDEYMEIPQYSTTAKEGSGRRKVIIVLVVAIIIVAGLGALSFAQKSFSSSDQPQLAFTGSAGVINGDEYVLYVALPDGSNIRAIHGASLYDCDKTEKGEKDVTAITSDYEYTKSIDSTFRAIFFDLADFEDNIQQGVEYTYTVDMSFTVGDSNEIYDYSTTVSFVGGQLDNVADIVFDHSTSGVTQTTEPATNEATTAQSTTQATTQATTSSTVDASYIYNSFWYTQPYNDADNYNIWAYQFKQDGTYVETYYYKSLNADWTSTVLNGTFKIEGDKLIITGDDSGTMTYTLDSSNTSTIKGDEDTLTARKYNSLKNAEDFFGL